ncbi:hypothetical protein GCM10023221_14070 [Luteimicrobium xylanilyticum]|uniref:Uncharacterized protein n=1 Tax=Luteimicrobium xylanilyticum TaxID=1133546 RepID=A0A5P9QCE1_9MICO|nr:hypothetical protein [Luteimicrobium xylanilyticum]QFU99121.1 hypothetical protein KDY119_02647 [Luteimicrobium xylanilyticum]
MSTGRARVLLVAFTRHHDDVRVRRLVRALARTSDVTTAGYGPAVSGALRHVTLGPADSPHPPATAVATGWLARGVSPLLRSAAARTTAATLAGDRWDVVVAVGVDTLPVARHLADGAAVWADVRAWPDAGAHGPFAPLERDALLRVLHEDLPRCAAVTAASGALADLVRREVPGLEPDVVVVQDTWPRAELAPTPVGDPIRLVRAGAARANAGLETTVEAVRTLGAGWSLDLLLVPGSDDAVLRRLHERTAELAQVRILPAPEPDDLPAALHGYDVATWWVPPTTTQACAALPSFLLAAVQARCAVAVGPAAQAERLVRSYGLGAVAVDVFAATCAASVRRLGRDGIAAAKERADAAAGELSRGADDTRLTGVLDRLRLG